MKAAQYGTKDIYKSLAARVAKESGIDKNLVARATQSVCRPSRSQTRTR